MNTMVYIERRGQFHSWPATRTFESEQAARDWGRSNPEVEIIYVEDAKGKLRIIHDATA